MKIVIRLIGIAFVLTAPVAALAWTGPTQSAPNGNASAPINVGAVDQVKSANLGVNGIAVFGNSLLGGAVGSNAYLNFGATSGSGGYGVRDNAGTLEFKNTGGSWQSLQSMAFGSSQWTTSGNNIYNTNSGAVNIGTQAAGGDGSLTHKLLVANPSDATEFVGVGYQDAGDYGFVYAVDNGVAWKNLILNPVGGGVGVGMNPAATFHVAGTIGATSWIGAGCETSCETGGGYALMYANGSIVGRGAPSWGVDSRAVYGGYFEGSSSYGAYGYAPASGAEGVVGNAPNGIGVRGYGGSGSWGGYFRAGNGVYGHADASGQGVQGYSASGWAGYFTSSSGHGVYGHSSGGGQGVQGYSAAGWAGHFTTAGPYGMYVSNGPGYYSYIAYSSYGLLTNGNAYAAAFYYNSDSRLKKNIATLSGALKKVLGMRGVSYEWNDQSTQISTGTELGLIAQEVEAIAPELVRTDEKGYKAVDYPRVVPLLIEAIKEQNARIDAQQVEIDELKSAIMNLTNVR